MKRIAIIGGGLAGVASAYYLAQAAKAGADIEVHLFEATGRLGGIIETVREGGYIVECGPDAWVSEKPWALELATELGLAGEVIYSQDATRKTYIRLEERLEAMPDRMRMMVPSDLAAVDASSLFSSTAKQAFHEEITRAESLRTEAPPEDESVAAFVERHFGSEVLNRIAAPLLGGVFGGDVTRLSVRAVMPSFVAMEREYGSLILAAQAKAAKEQKPIFTTLRSGTGRLIEGMVATIPQPWIHLSEEVRALRRTGNNWSVTIPAGNQTFDAVLMAAPIDVARVLLSPIDLWASELMEMETSSAVVVTFCFPSTFDLPQGFGFLVPPGQGSLLLACTFTDQKFESRVPAGARQIRAFFGAAAADRLMHCKNDEIASVARLELARILGSYTGPLPEPILTVVRRWPQALPQYGVGHLDRMAALDIRIRAQPSLWLLGNAYRGVGIPDLIRDAKNATAELLA